MKLDFCVVCGINEGLEHHHIMPRSLGGTDDPINLLTLCVEHHCVIHQCNNNVKISRSVLTKNALQARKAKGLPMGRPAGVSKLDALSEVIKGYQAKGLNLTAISKLIDCNRQTLANWLESNKPYCV